MKGLFWNGDINNNFIGHIAAEIYKDQVYHSLVDGKKDLVILDVGANIGLTAHYFSQYASKVYAVEPAKEHFECLSKMVEFNELKEIIVPINKALYLKSGQFPLHHNPNRTMYSLHTAVSDGTHEMVESTTLTDIFKEHNIKHVDLFKLDIEGSEPEVLAHSSFQEVAPLIDTLIMESHNWSGRNPNQVNEALEMAGFTKITQIPNAAHIVLAQK